MPMMRAIAIATATLLAVASACGGGGPRVANEQAAIEAVINSPHVRSIEFESPHPGAGPCDITRGGPVALPRDRMVRTGSCRWDVERTPDGWRVTLSETWPSANRWRTTLLRYTVDDDGVVAGLGRSGPVPPQDW